MSRDGHRVTNAALALAILACAPTPTTIPFAIGVLAGSSAPDDLEFPRWIGTQRVPLIPHRTFTHWGLAWIALCAALVLLATSVGPAPAAWFAAGWSCGAILHLLTDSGTKRGIPWLLPQTRNPLPCALYDGGNERSELVVRAVACAILLLAIVLRGGAMLAAYLPWQDYAIGTLKAWADVVTGHVAIAQVAAPSIILALLIAVAFRKIATTIVALIRTAILAGCPRVS